jgi:hypothetical protein
MFFRFVRWGAGIVLSLLALAFTAINLARADKLTNISQVWEGGELFLIAVIVTSGALVDLLISKTPHYKRKAFLGLVSVIFLLIFSYWYVEMSSETVFLAPTHPNTIHNIAMICSPIGFAFAIVLGVACLLLSTD